MYTTQAGLVTSDPMCRVSRCALCPELSGSFETCIALPARGPVIVSRAQNEAGRQSGLAASSRHARHTKLHELGEKAALIIGRQVVIGF